MVWPDGHLDVIFTVRNTVHGSGSQPNTLQYQTVNVSVSLDTSAKNSFQCRHMTLLIFFFFFFNNVL